MYLLNNGMGPGIPISQLPLISNYNLELNGSEQIAIARDNVTYKTDLLDVGNYYYTSLGIDNLAALSGGWQETFITVTNRSFFWDSVYSSVAATSGSWDSVYSTVNELSDFWDGDFCNETVFLSTVSGCKGEPINMSNSSISNVDSITANEIHTLSSFTHYQDILISELSGFEVGGSVEVAEKVTIGSLEKGPETLNVDGNVLVEGGWVSLSSNENSGQAFITTDGTDGGIGFTGTANRLIDNGGDGADLYVDNDGNTATRGNLSVNTDQTVSMVTIKGGDIAIDGNGDNNWGFIGQGTTGTGIGLKGAGASLATESDLYVSQGGKVGIATETPSSLLHLSGGDIRIDSEDGLNRTFISDFGTIELTRDSGSSFIDFKGQLGNDYDSRIIHTTTSELQFRTGGLGGQTTLSLTPDGNAIVDGTISASCGNSDEWCSTTSTVESLSDAWNRSLSVSVSATPPPAYDRQNGDLWFDSSSGDLYMWYIDGTSDQWIDVNALGGSGSAFCDTTLFLNQVSACNGEMFIEGIVNVDGQVDSNADIITRGTGTSTRLLPDGRIEIRKDGAAPVIDFKSSANDYDTRIKSTPSGSLTFNVGGDGSIIADAFTIANDGNVGVGDLNPAHKLSIKDGDIRMSTGGDAGFITQDGTTGGIGFTGNVNRLIDNGGDGADLYVTDVGNSFVRKELNVKQGINCTGSVSISGANLDGSGLILNPISGSIELIDSTGSDNPFIDFKTARGEGHDTRIIQSDNGLKFNTGGDGNTATAVYMRNDGNTDFGIFTTTVAQGDRIRVRGEIAINSDDDGNFGYIGQGSGDGIGLRGFGPSSSTYDLYVDDSGNVGIGEMDPYSKLEVVGDITVTSVDAGGNSGFITNDGTGTGGSINQGIGLCGAAARLVADGGVGPDFYVSDAGDSVARNSLTVQGPAVIVPQSRPSSPVAGTIILNSGTNVFEGFNGSTWVPLS